MYRLGSAGEKPEFVDTVAFACFRKSLWVSLGGFDEKLLTNEDYDFNYRVKFRGERVLLDRSEHCDYFARTTPGSLAHQYWRYGWWKAQMIKQHPGSMRLRHLVAPAFVTSIALLVAIGVWQSIFWALVALELAVYLLVATTFSYQGAKRNGERLRVMLAMPLVFFTIHFCWGTSFLVGLIRRPR
jgi:GT2 family glycosyltransferase